MSPKEDNSTEFLEKYRPIILKKLEIVKERRELRSLASQLGFEQARLSEIMSGNRKLTEHYIRRMVLGGFLKVDEIMQASQARLSPDEETFWQEMRILEDKDYMRIIVQIDNEGLRDKAKSIFKALLPTK